MPLDFVGDQLKDSYGGVLHIQNESDVDNDNTGFDPLRPDDVYRVYDGNGRQIPISFQGNTVIVPQLTVLSPVVEDILPARKTVNYQTNSNVPANGTAPYLVNLGYASISLRKVTTDVPSIIRIYPSEEYGLLDIRNDIVDLTDLPPSDCALINQVSTLANSTVLVSGQTVGMTDNGQSYYYMRISNLSGDTVPINITFDFLALEAAQEVIQQVAPSS